MAEQQKQKDLMKVHYFYIRGQCQPIRNLLYYMGVEFQDIMHEKTAQNSIDASFNLGFPMVEDGEVKVHDAIAIMNYLCRKYERLDLLGLTPQSLAKIQEVVIRYSLQKKRIIIAIYDMIGCIATSNEAQKERLIKQKLGKMLAEYKFVGYCLKKVALSKGFVFGTLCVVDFLFYEICFYLYGFFYEQLKRHIYFKHFLQFKRHFEKLPFFKNHQSKLDEKYIFFEFDDVQMNKNIEKYWKGTNRCLKATVKQL